ncbi:hypothetical protein BGZ49_007323 [Haplosporangium sp. Z 27]|nr:hypothetical protein BGZ49_007323 [Haplosporangium sp. Z 27]
MHRRHLAEDQSQVPQSDVSHSSSRRTPVLQSHYSSHSNFSSDTDSEIVNYPTISEQRSNIRQTNDQRTNDHADHVALSEPPPTYEQSLFTAPAWFPNPFMRSSRTSAATAPPQEQQNSNQLFAPRLAPRNAPSAPPVSLLNSTSGNSSGAYTSDDSLLDTSPSSVRRGKRPVRNRQMTETDESSGFGEQFPMSPSYLHPSNISSPTSSPLSTKESGYFDSVSASAQNLRTSRRLEHKQALAQHAASAPDLYPEYPQSPSPPHHQSNKYYQSSTHAQQSEIPAPPPRLYRFRSRNPSSVPMCPYPLCQKPIKATKTRLERGVTVWLACGLLFLCNTYWTSHVVIDYFSSPSRDRVLSRETQAASDAASSSFTARKEAAHLVKGLLGIKSHRYQDPNLIKYQRHLNGLNRPTVATVGVVTDEQSALRAILSLMIIAFMASIRGLISLSPLLAKPLFDTIHSCPHQHPYPYPEELETERKLVEEYDTEGLISITPEQQEKLAAVTQWYYGDEKKRLREKDEAEAAAANGQDTNSNGNTTTSNAVVRRANTDQLPPKPSRFRFFQRIKEIRQEAKQKSDQAREATVALAAAATATAVNIKKKKLPWGIKRAIKLAQERRMKFVTASQVIGRYSIIYEIGYFVRMDWWKKNNFPQERSHYKRNMYQH